MASLRLPYPPYLWKVIRRSVGIWLLVRIAYAFLMLAMALFGLVSPEDGVALALYPSWATRALLVAAAAAGVWWDRRRFHELLLHANLGTWPGWFWTASLIVGLALDVGVQALLSAL